MKKVSKKQKGNDANTLLATCAFKVGDKIKWNDVQRAVRGDCFTDGKTVETIVKIDFSPKPKETRLWMTNGLNINPECVVLA